jgi:hypothetical protein
VEVVVEEVAMVLEAGDEVLLELLRDRRSLVDRGLVLVAGDEVPLELDNGDRS